LLAFSRTDRETAGIDIDIHIAVGFFARRMMRLTFG
jgi:hypothetical protein